MLTLILSVLLLVLVVTLMVLVYRRKCWEQHLSLVAKAHRDIDASWWRERLETIYGEAGARESAPHLYT
jgi:hypothetical protein